MVKENHEYNLWSQEVGQWSHISESGFWKLVNGVTFGKGLSLSLRPNYQLVTVENRSSFSEKGQLKYVVQENCSLTSQDRNFEIMGQTNYNTLDDVSFRENPQLSLSMEIFQF